MVKARDINKDIRSIAKKIGIAVFSYDEVHNPKINNEFHYDYELVIDRVSKLNGWDRKKCLNQLLKRDILSSLPNGEYKVNVGASTKKGGGLNYYGVAFFTLVANDYQVKYHELAHSLQKKYGLFNEEKVNKLYRASAKGIAEDKVENKQLNSVDYKLYLNEMHSESFSYAALMLRAESSWDFIKQAYSAYNDARFSSVAGFFSFGKTKYGGEHNSAKFYSTFPVIKETIKAVMKIRKQGKSKDFFDENGVLKDEKLAKLCEQAVLKSAYSPRTLNSFFKYRLFDGHNGNEHGWRKDALKGIATTLYSPLIVLANEDNSFQKLKSILKHKKMEKEEKKKINQMSESRRFDDPETQALHDFIQFHKRCAQLSAQNEDKVNADTLFAQSVSVLRYQDKTIHESGIRNQASLLLDASSKKQEKLGDEMVAMRYWIRDHQDNPYFCHLIANDIELSEAIQMYNEKLKNPEKKQIVSPTPIKVYPLEENRWFAINGVRNSMLFIDEFTKDFKCSDTFRQALINLSLQDVSKIDDPQIRKNLARLHHFKMDLFGRKRRKFAKELNETLNAISETVFDQRNNLSYNDYKKQFEGMSLDEILAKTKEHKDAESAKKKSSKSNTTNKEDVKIGENMELAVQIANNNMEAVDFLADRYGLSLNLRKQIKKMVVMPADKLENKQLRKALLGVVHFEGDWFGREKRSFKRDLNKLLNGALDDIRYQKDNPAYTMVCQEFMQSLMHHPSPVKTDNTEMKTAEVKAAEAPARTEEKTKTPKEIVADKLRAWGIEDGTYMLITKDDNLHTRYDGADGPIARSVDGYFEEGKKDLAKTGRDAVYGTNNGLIGAYFAEGVYMVSANDKLYNVMYRHAANTSLGVMLSNGESFVDVNANFDETKYGNKEWENAKTEANKLNKAREEANQQKQTATAAQKVSDTLNMIIDVADRHDAKGELKQQIVDTYIKDEGKLLSMEFWGETAKKFSLNSPVGQEQCVNDLAKLGLNVGRDVTENRDNSQYHAVKSRCAEEKNADGALHMAQVCAKRSQTTLSPNDYAIAASR